MRLMKFWAAIWIRTVILDFLSNGLASPIKTQHMSHGKTSQRRITVRGPPLATLIILKFAFFLTFSLSLMYSISRFSSLVIGEQIMKLLKDKVKEERDFEGLVQRLEKEKEILDRETLPSDETSETD